MSARIFALLLLTLTASIVQMSVYAQVVILPPASAPGAQSAGAAKLRELLDAGGLELSDQPGSAQKEFSFHVILAIPSPDKAPHYIVCFGGCKNGKMAAMIWAYDAHEPLLYSSPDLLVCPDREKPGSLLVGIPRVGPSFVMGPNTREQVRGDYSFEIAMDSEKGPATLRLDFAYILKGMQQKMRTAVFDPKTNSLLCTTEHSTFTLFLHDGKGKGFPVGKLYIGAQDTTHMAIFIDETPLVDLFSLDRTALAKLGPPLTDFHDRTFLAKFSVAPVLPMTDSPEILKVAEKLGTLLRVEKTSAEEIVAQRTAITQSAAKPNTAATAPK